MSPPQGGGCWGCPRMTGKVAKAGKKTRDGRFPIRLSKDERADFERKQLEAGSPSLAAYLRDCILQSQVVAKPRPSADRGRMLFLMNKASNNINQLAHQVNSAHKAGTVNESTYRRILFDLDTLMAYLKATVSHVD